MDEYGRKGPVEKVLGCLAAIGRDFNTARRSETNGNFIIIHGQFSPFADHILTFRPRA
jgi:hypothetical protein